MHGNKSSFSTVKLSAGGQDHSQPPTQTIQFYLEVSRGQTVFRRRPITGSSFLIGSGDHCDLQLGGDEIPLLFGIMEIDGDHLSIRSVESSPELKINGQVVSSAQLSDGDVIEIGTFQFVARKQETPDPSLTSAFTKVAGSKPRSPSTEDQEVDLSELSAAELLDRMEQDLELVDEFERGQRQGWGALLEQVERRKEALSRPSRRIDRRQKISRPRRPRVPRWEDVESDLMADSLRRVAHGRGKTHDVHEGLEIEYIQQIERMINELSQVTSDLEERSEQMSQRDIDYLEAASSIMETQQKLAEQLQTLIEHVDQTSNHESKKIEPFDAHRRAIA